MMLSDKKMNRYATWLSLLLVSGSMLLAHTSHVAGTTAIRGVPLAMRSIYNPSRDFECLDGSLLIPFANVNDNYCDCADASDEPGTSACGNGVFYCENTGYQSYYVPSSWVNDGVCDCCDASDEYDYSSSTYECQNTCHMLAKEAKLVQQKAKQEAHDGNKLRLELASKGKAIKLEYQSQLAKLKTNLEEAELTKKEKEVLKTEIEEKERLALEKYKSPEPEQVADEESSSASATKILLDDPELEKCFHILDDDNDGTLSLQEVEDGIRNGKDLPSTVTVDDATHVLFGHLSATWEEFLSIAQGKEHHAVKLAVEKIKAVSRCSTRELSDDEGEEDESDVGEKEEEETEAEAEAETETGVEEEAEDLVRYDEVTQALIDEANSARERLQEAEKAVSELQTEINQLEMRLRHNYGPDNEFASLYGKCFEYTDVEYIYKLCLYDRATQRSKSHGGSEVNLGQFNKFVEPTGTRFYKMEYDKGLTCWNGPPRTTLVTLSCGMENKLVSVTEPSRCEYVMELTTPALCRTDSIETADMHGAQQTPDAQQTTGAQQTLDEQQTHDEL